MRHSRLWLSAIIIAVVVIGAFVLNYLRTQDTSLTQDVELVAPTAPNVAIKDAFKKEMHTITGSLEVANACTKVAAESVYASTTDQHILVSLTVPADTERCLQLPTTATFTTAVRAPAKVPIIVTVNEAVASTTAL